MSGDRVGLLIIRVWTEGGSSAPLRARIRQTTDLSAGLQDGVTVSNDDAVVALVKTWLQAAQAAPDHNLDADLTR